MVFMGKYLFDRSVSKIFLSLSLLIRKPVMSITNAMKCHDKWRMLIDRPALAINCLVHVFNVHREHLNVYNEPISTLFNVTEPDKGASSAHYEVLKPLCAEGS